MKTKVGIAITAALALTVTVPGPTAAADVLPTAVCDTSVPLSVLNFNDFHGRLAASSPNTAAWVGTIEEQRALAGEANTVLIAAGDSVGATLFASSAQNDEPTIELLNALDVTASSVGNHEYDQGWPDLRDRIEPGVNFPYLAANVIDNATGQPALPGYTVVERNGLRVGIVGGVTQDLGSLVSPAGLTGLTVRPLVPAVNSTIANLKDGNTANGEADVIIVTVHEGAPDGTKTMQQNMAESPNFAAIVNDLDPRAQVVVNGHTHQAYAYTAPNGTGTRPLISTAGYASGVGRVQLTVDATTGATCSAAASVLPVTTTPVADLLASYPRVVEAKAIVDDALAKAAIIGQRVIGKATAPITRALTTLPNGTISDDRARESTMSNLVAQMFYDTLSNGDKDFIGMQNPGGNRADFDAGDITYAEAAGILPFANTLMTTQLTGAQVKKALEQQWQRDAEGKIPSRPYLQLGLSKNVTYTYDAALPEGSRITSIRVNGAPIDPAKKYTVGSGSFLIAGGDNFHEIAKGTAKTDTGRADLEAWVAWITEKGTLSPSYVKQAVSVHPLPTVLQRKKKVSFEVGVPQDTVAPDTLDFKTNGIANDNVIAWIKVKNRGLTPIGAGDVQAGKTTVTLRVPAWVKAGPAVLTLKAYDSKTVIKIPVTIKK